MNTSTDFDASGRTFRQETALVFVSIVLPFIGILLYLYLPGADQLSFTDNDDYLRYFQFTHWINSGEWYLRPIEQFNPQSGVLIHWSRLVDIPLGTVTLLLTPFFGVELASKYATGIVPVFYLIAILLALATIANKLFGSRYIALTCIYFIGSIAISKFKPGSIDHHNIQMVLFAWSIAVLPINAKNAGCWKNSFVYALLLSTSLWIGLENIIVFALTLFLIVLVGYSHCKQYLLYFTRVCTLALLLSTMFTLFNRPITEFLTFYIDMLSWPYLFCLLVGVGYGVLSQRLVDKYRYYAFFILTTLAIITILIVAPELLTGVYHNYPELLKKVWLNHVTEARSISNYVIIDGWSSNHLHFLYIFPALVSLCFIRENRPALLCYFLMLIVFVFSLFWQVRVIFNVYILAVPFQAFVINRLCCAFKTTIVRLVVVFIFSPVIVSMVITCLNNEFKNIESPSVRFDKSTVATILNENEIFDKKILAPIDFGAAIIALTNNSVISAPYHRNTDGNTEMVRLFTSDLSLDLRNRLLNNKFDYIMIGSDRSTEVLLEVGGARSLIRSLYDGDMPSWVSLVAEDKFGNKLFKIK